MAPLDLATFATLVGDTFSVQPAPGVGALSLRLASATPLHTLRPAAVAGTAPEAGFTLLFHGPPTPLLSQAMYSFVHPRLGTHEIFIVPVGRDADGVRYEAIFN